MSGIGSPKGVKNGGRTKGTANKPRKELEEWLRERFGDDFDAVVELADIAVSLRDEPEQLDRRIKCLETVARYTRAQLKSVEHKGSVNHAVDMVVNADELRLMSEFMHASNPDG